MSVADRVSGLVDLINSSREHFPDNNLEDIYRQLGVQRDVADLRTTIHDGVRGLFENATGEYLRPDQRSGLRKAVWLVSAVSGTDPKLYLEVLGVIDDATRQGRLCSLGNVVVWRAAINFARLYLALYGPIPSIEQGNMAVSAAICRLLSAGAEFDLSGETVNLTEKSLISLCQEMDKLSETAGGINIISALLSNLQSTGDFYEGRYVNGRKFVAAWEMREPSIPVGYLINLAAKHVDSKTLAFLDPEFDSRSSDIAFSRLLELSRDVCSALDVEPYSSFEVVIAKRAELVPAWLRSVALYDHLFSIRQLSPSVTARLVEGLLSVRPGTRRVGRVG